MLDTSRNLERIYNEAAQRGSTSPPLAEDEVDLHYICFIRSHDGWVYEMDGETNGPIKTDCILKQSDDMLTAPALECVNRCIAREEADMKFSLLALVQHSSGLD